jgi:hypothetical protein
LGASILNGNGISVVVKPRYLDKQYTGTDAGVDLHMCEKIDSISVVIDQRITYDTQGVQLVA